MSFDEQEDSKKRPHVADGIEEYDNKMPQWWIGLFYFTIIFSILYLVVLHVFKAPSLEDELAKESKELMSLQASGSSSGGSNSSSANSFKDRIKSKEVQALGKEIFKTNCLPCHGEFGQGGIGPNLTDEYWIHGGSDQDIIQTISGGVLDKGMPPWLQILGPEKVEAVAAYVISLQGTKPPNPKEPQGQKFVRQAP